MAGWSLSQPSGPTTSSSLHSRGPGEEGSDHSGSAQGAAAAAFPRRPPQASTSTLSCLPNRIQPLWQQSLLLTWHMQQLRHMQTLPRAGWLM